MLQAEVLRGITSCVIHADALVSISTFIVGTCAF